MDLGPELWTFLPGGRAPAPGALWTIQAFVNTTNRETGQDALDSPGALSSWLSRFGLLPGDAPASQSDLVRARELREALRSLMLANSGQPADRTALEPLNRTARTARLTVVFGERGAALEPDDPGVDGALGELVAIAFTAMADGSWKRLKACRRDVCHWAFYDHSKNLSGAWCAMAICGNRTKTRSYRRRRQRPADR